MRTSRLLAAVLALSFVVACETKAPPEDQAAREGTGSRIKGQIRDGVDGGAVSDSGISPLNSQPPTITYTATATQTATGTRTGTGTVSTTVTNTVTNTNTVTGITGGAIGHPATPPRLQAAMA